MWPLIWACLLVLSGIYLATRVWGLWGQAKDLGSELVIAQQRLDDVQGELELLGEKVTSAEQLAVFADPNIARKQRERARAAGRRARRRRQQDRAVSRSHAGSET